MPKSPDSSSQSNASPAASPDAVVTDAPVTTTATRTAPVTAPIPIPTLPITAPTVPVIAPTATTTVSLSTASPSTTTNAPTSSVSVDVPGETGSLRFSLVVTDNLGQQSAPAYVTVNVQGLPIANITAAPTTIVEGGPVELSGAGSTSSGSIENSKFSLAPIVVT